MKKLLILDSNSILNRAYYGIRFLSNSKGTPTNAIYGFLNILMKLISDENPDYICAAFDLKAPTFRHKMYSEYKAGRKPMPDDLKVQMPIAKKLISEMRIPLLELEGYEADDIIGTVSRICDEKDIKCLIATGDKDDLQLVTENTNVILTVSRMGESETVCYGIKEVFDKYNVTPTEFIDLKAIMGDPSDNIPGVKGIGEKGAIKLISEYHSIENLYDKLGSSDIKGATLTKLQEGKDSAFMSKTLATICKEVPIELDFEKAEFDIDKLSLFSGFTDMLKELELKSFLKRFNTVEEKNLDFYENMKIVSSPEKLGSTVSCVLERNGKSISAIALASDKGVFKAFGTEAASLAKTILENEKIEKIMFDFKSDIVALSNISFNNVIADASIGAYLLNPSKSEYTIFGCGEEYLHAPIPEKKGNIQLSLLDDEIEEDDTFEKSAYCLFFVWNSIKEKLISQNQLELFNNIEMPLIYVLADMENAGIAVDKEELNCFGEKLSVRIDELTKEIYSLCDTEFNINSPKQLGAILFEKLSLTSAKKTKSGYATGADILEKLKEKHPVINLILEYRQLTKLKSTYCDGLSAVVNKETGRIHSQFNQTVTVTGRLSSTEPNLQNIPTRTELGREIRKMFVAGEGNILLDADYSQIELRVLAHLSDDEVMKNAFIKGEDIHSVTASQVFNVPISEVTPAQRRFAKTVNFGIVYGMGEFSLAQDLGISIKEAKKYISDYWEKYSGVLEFMTKTKENAKKSGYVSTMFGRLRYIPELRSPNFNIRSFGERAATNTPIQGTAADIIKIAMIKVHDRLIKEGLKAKLILQVHDELILELPKAEEKIASKILREEMENAAKLNVPLLVEMESGDSWYDAK